MSLILRSPLSQPPDFPNGAWLYFPPLKKRVFRITDPGYAEVVLSNPDHAFSRVASSTTSPLWEDGLTEKLQHRQLADYARTILSTVTETFSAWAVKHRVDLIPELRALSLAIAARTLFSLPAFSVPMEALAVIFEATTYVVRFSRRGWLRRALQNTAAKQKAFQAVQSTLGDAMLLAILGIQPTKQSVRNIQALRHEACLFLAESVMKPTSVLAWCFESLGRYPDIEERLRDEVRAVWTPEAPMHALPQLRYMDTVLKELLRLYPPVPFLVRTAVYAITLGATVIPAGSTVVIDLHRVHRHPLYFPGAGTFRPERWTLAFEQSLPPGGYLPFGFEGNACFMQPFAVMQVKLVLASMLSEWLIWLEKPKVGREDRLRGPLWARITAWPEGTSNLREVPISR